MPGVRLRKDGQPDGRSLRHKTNTTPTSERSAMMRELQAASVLQRRANKIARLIESAPPLTTEQRARLRVLLNGGHAGGGGE